MKCPFCGYDNTPGSKFCSGCGRKLGQETFSSGKEKPGRSPEEKRIILAGVILACLVVAGGIGAYLGISHFMEKRKESQEASYALSAESDGGSSVSGSEKPEEQPEGSSPAETLTPAAAATPSPTQTPSLTPAETPAPTPEPFSVFLTDVNTADLEVYSKVRVTEALASSEVYQEGYDNSPAMMLDGDPVTSWQEGADGNGINEFVSFKLDREYQVKYITLNLGNWRGDLQYKENATPRTLTIWLDNRSFQVDFPYEKTQFCLEFSSPCPASEVYVRIDDVYEGTQYDDACISEMGIYGE